jgi:hypothetical protein
MSELRKKAEALKSKAGSIWDEHPIHTVRNWQYAVANDYTRLGYWEWVANILLQELDAG